MAHGDEKSIETLEGLLSDFETPKRFSHEELLTFTSKFSSSLGSGGFGDVYKGTLHNGLQVAVKVLKGALLSDGVKDQFKAEVQFKAEMRSLGKIHHKHVVKLFGFCFEQNMKALVYEFMENGSLDELLYGNQSIAWETLCNIVVGTAKGLAYLHDGCKVKILHYNVKPANILLDSKFSPKVGDFGLAKLLNQDMTHITESRFRGTPNYGAPELCMPYSQVTDKCDVFSFGITLFDIIGRRKHGRGEGQKWFPVQVWKKFKEEKQEEIIQECGVGEKDKKQAKRILLIALWCAQFLPEDRPSMSHVVRLLESSEEIAMPPNPFLLLRSSSSTQIEYPTPKSFPSVKVTEEVKLSPNPIHLHMGSSSAATEGDSDDEKSSETMDGLLSDLETPKRFSPKQLEKFTAGFSKSLGSGAFGEVFKGVLHDGVQVAVKVLKGGILSEAKKDQFMVEMSVHGNIHHKHVVKLYGFCFEQNTRALVYEFMENESLEKQLYGNQSITWETLCKIAVGTANGLAYLHEDCQPKIIHYNIKPTNILLDSEFSPKIGDVGLAMILNQDTTHITTTRFRGTPIYGAPELCMSYSQVTDKCDVFSFGISLFDIIGRRRHVRGFPVQVRGEGEKWLPVQVWKKFVEGEQEEIMQECGIHENDRKHAKQILLIALWCVQFSPGNRPSMSHVVRLLEGTEEITMPPNPFSSSRNAPHKLKASSSFTKVKLPPNPFLMHMGSSKTVTEGDKKGNISRTTLGPWGGHEGSRFDDGIFAGIKKIKVFKGIKGDVYAIRVWYYGKEGESISTGRHGDCEVDTIDTIELDYPSEYLVRVTGFHGYEKFDRVRSLCFFTNNKKYGPFGVEKGSYFSTEKDGKDGKVIGFHGRAEDRLDAIGVHMEYNKDYPEKVEENDAINVACLKPTTIGPWGGVVGEIWDDGVYPGIMKIDIGKGIRDIESMQIWYWGKDGDPICCQRRGFKIPHTIETIELDYPSEYLMRVTGSYGFGDSRSDQVGSLCFFSNKKKYGPFGEEKGSSFSTEKDGKDGKVIGFHGNSGSYLYAIGMHMDYS